MHEIKKRYRELVKIYHPEGTNPDIEKFREIKEIYSTLINHTTRKRYNNISEESGEFFLGILEKERLRQAAWERNVSLGDLIQDRDFSVTETKKNVLGSFYTYTADSDSCCERAQQWYEQLLQVSYLYGYTDTLRVALCPLDDFAKITERPSGYIIFWFHSAIKPSWIVAFYSFYLLRNKIFSD